MISDIVENIQAFGPVVAVIWLVTIGLTLWKPQRYWNSFLLLIALMATMLWPSALIREFVAVFLTKRFLIWALIGYFLCANLRRLRMRNWGLKKPPTVCLFAW